MLAVVLTGRTSADTALGAQIHFRAPLACLPMHAIGIAYLRTLVWAVSVYGPLQVLLALFRLG